MGDLLGSLVASLLGFVMIVAQLSFLWPLRLWQFLLNAVNADMLIGAAMGVVSLLLASSVVRWKG